LPEYRKALIRKTPGYHNNLWWERLPAAKLNDRGWQKRL